MFNENTAYMTPLQKVGYYTFSVLVCLVFSLISMAAVIGAIVGSAVLLQALFGVR